MRVRFTVRRAMLAVALVAVAAAGVRSFVTLRARSRLYQSQATVHHLTSRYNDIVSRSRFSGHGVAEREAAKKLSVWHAQRRDLYKAAAARPWRVVPPEAEPQAVSDGNKAVSDGNKVGSVGIAAGERLRTRMRQILRSELGR